MTFLDFFANLQRRQETAGPPLPALAPPSTSNASAAARAAAAGTQPVRRRASQPPPAAANTPSASTSARAAEPLQRLAATASAISTGSIANQDAFFSREVQGAAGRVGRQLAALRSEQDQQAFGRREAYSMEHVERLYMFKPATPYARARANRLCSKTHPQPCQFSCKTCHFCRQRTTEIKTVCSKCEGVKEVVGGPARGYWCGSCLWLRMGENIDEVRGKTDWVCPGCREICNCSGANCMRNKKGWFPTNQLAHEAKHQGFASVAHYLVLTNVSESVGAASIADLSNYARVVPRQTAGEADQRRAEGVPPKKRQKTMHDFSDRGREQELQARLQEELAAVLEELGGGMGSIAGAAGSAAAPTSALQQLLSGGQMSILGGSGGVAATRHFLGILDTDMIEEDDVVILQSPTAPPVVSSGPQQSAARRESVAVVPSAIQLDLLPPRQPPARRRDPVEHHPRQQLGAVAGEVLFGDDVAAAAASVSPPAGDAEDPRQEYDGAGMMMHHGLPEADAGDAFDAATSRAAARAPRQQAMAIPGWQTRRPPDRSEGARGHHARVPPPGQLRSPQRHRQGHSGGGGGVAREWETGVTADEYDAEEGDWQQQPPRAGETPREIAAVVAAPAAALAANTTPQQPTPAAAAATPAAASTVETHPNIASGPPAPPSTAAEGIEENATAGAPPAAAPPCLDAHTPLAALAAARSSDETVWAGLRMRAHSIVSAVHDLYRHHPDSPAYVGPLMGPEEDIAAYEAAYDASFEQLKAVLREAEGLTLDDTAVTHQLQQGDAAQGLSPAGEQSAGKIRTHGGLRHAVELLTYLARLLPKNDVEWGIERRLLGAEPFVAFAASDVRARAILLRGMLELLATLHRRGFPTDAVAGAVSGALACLARDMRTALPILNAILAKDALPEGDFELAGWRYDAAARGRVLEMLFAELSGLYASLMQALTTGLQRVTAVASVLGLQAAAFLTPELVDALLGPQAKLPAAVKKNGLALFCSVLDTAHPRVDSPLDLHLTADERNVQLRTRLSLANTVQASLVPALETMVRKDYPLWGDAQCPRPEAADCEESAAEHVGCEKVEALAQCYAFLLRSDRLGWPGIEAKAAQPYSYLQFWRQANSAYRHFAVFLLAHALHHAPKALSAQAHATSALRMWLQALLDTGRRHCTWYLGKVLAENPHTKPLFAGVPEHALEDVKEDVEGRRRAALAGAVIRSVASAPAWRPQLAALTSELDGLLAARKREIELHAFDAAAASQRWEATSSRILVEVLRGAAGVLAPTQGAGGRPQREFAAGQLLRVAHRVAAWAMGACAAAHKSGRRQAPAESGIGSIAGMGVSDDIHDGADDIRSVSEARQHLRASSFDSLSALFNSFVAAGAPAALDLDPELLEPLYVVVAGCIELGSGEIKPTDVDTAMFQMLGDVLAPRAPEGDSEWDARFSPRHQICIYALDTLVRRYLQRSSLRHVANERAAVNALRLVGEVLEQPCMRSGWALQAALSSLLRPLLSVLNPEGGVKPSAGAKSEVYKLLSKLAKNHPAVMPAMSPAPRGNSVDAALHAFWLAVCRDALHCVVSLPPSDLRKQKLQAARGRISALGASSSSSVPVLPLWPTTDATVIEVSNALLGCLGRPRSLDPLERLISRPGGGPVLQAAPPAVSSPTLFRPGSFPWDVAEEAIALLRTFAETGSGSGALWALACFPALHYLIDVAGQVSNQLRAAHDTLRSALESALGPECTAAYQLPKPPTLPAAPQEQLQPNTTASSASRGGGSAQDQTLVALSALPLQATAPVTALLHSKEAKSLKNGAAVFVCVLEDFSGPGGAAACAKLMVTHAKAVEAVAALNLDAPRAVRFSRVRVMKHAKDGMLCVLATLDTTELVLSPTGALAETLRRCAAPLQQHHNLVETQPAEFAATQETLPALGAPVVKSEPKEVDGGTQQRASDQQPLMRACRQLEEMGFGKEAIERAMRKIMARKGGGSWAAMTEEQLVREAIEELQ